MSTSPALADVLVASQPARPLLDQHLAGLLRQTAAGDHGAFSELYDLTEKWVYGAAFRVLRVAELTDEVTQEVYLEVWKRSAGHYDPARAPVHTWLAVLTRRRAIDRVRQVERTRALEGRYASSDHNSESDVVWDDVAGRVDSSVVHAALGQLSAAQRDTLVLVYLGGHTHAEVARRMQVPLGTAKTRVRNALLRLRQLISTDGLEQGLTER